MAMAALGLKPGVVTGRDLLRLLEYAREHEFGGSPLFFYWTRGRYIL